MKIIIAGIILGVLLLIPNIHVSDSILFWNLLVTVKPETTPIHTNEFPVIIGTVTDEASKPIANALVKITFAKEVVTTTTDVYGNFRYQSVLPVESGYYMINAVVTKDGYGTGLASSTIMINPQTSLTSNRALAGEPLVVGNYTVFIGKVTDWNLETTCFVKFGDEYMRFLKTCDLYNLAPEDFKTDANLVHSVTVIKYNEDFRLFPVIDFLNTSKISDDSQLRYLDNLWANYTSPN